MSTTPATGVVENIFHATSSIAATICVFATSFSAFCASLDRPMQFSLHGRCVGTGCESFVLAQGTITRSTPATFRAFVAKLGHRPTIYFDSPGGDLGSGIELGLAIRKARLDTYAGSPYRTVVSSGDPPQVLVAEPICASACAYAFIGGVTREVDQSARIGVHQFRGLRGDSGEASAQVTVAVVSAYLDRMGVDRRLLDIAAAATPNQLHRISAREARELNVDNTEPPKATWKLDANADGKLYLLVIQRQSRRDGTLSLVLERAGQGYRAALIYRARQDFRTDEELADIFSGRTVFFVRTRSSVHEINSVENWRGVEGGYLIRLDLEPAVVAAIAKESEFEIDAEWPNALRDVKPNSGFGTVGFRNGVKAMAR